MTSQSSSGGSPTGAAGGGLAGTYPSPTLSGVGVPQELGYVQATTSFTGLGSGTDAVITGMTLTVVVGIRPIMVHYVCGYAAKGSATGAILLKIHDDTANEFVGVVQADLGPGSGVPLSVEMRLAPVSGSRVYTMYAQYSGGGTVGSLFGAATSPMWLQVREV